VQGRTRLATIVGIVTAVLIAAAGLSSLFWLTGAAIGPGQAAQIQQDNRLWLMATAIAGSAGVAGLLLLCGLLCAPALERGPGWYVAGLLTLSAGGALAILAAMAVLARSFVVVPALLQGEEGAVLHYRTLGALASLTAGSGLGALILGGIFLSWAQWGRSHAPALAFAIAAVLLVLSRALAVFAPLLLCLCLLALAAGAALFALKAAPAAAPERPQPAPAPTGAPRRAQRPKRRRR
jgi:hypothetical protein